MAAQIINKFRPEYISLEMSEDEARRRMLDIMSQPARSRLSPDVYSLDYETVFRTHEGLDRPTGWLTKMVDENGQVKQVHVSAKFVEALKQLLSDPATGFVVVDSLPKGFIGGDFVNKIHLTANSQVEEL